MCVRPAPTGSKNVRVEREHATDEYGTMPARPRAIASDASRRDAHRRHHPGPRPDRRPPGPALRPARQPHQPPAPRRRRDQIQRMPHATCRRGSPPSRATQSAHHELPRPPAQRSAPVAVVVPPARNPANPSPPNNSAAASGASASAAADESQRSTSLPVRSPLPSSPTSPATTPKSPPTAPPHSPRTGPPTPQTERHPLADELERTAGEGRQDRCLPALVGRDRVVRAGVL